jgi:exodeoxyribonuclease VII large subunit
MEVIVLGGVTVYERRGNYQIVVEEMQPRGMGALQLAFERLKRQLESEGLFDPRHKKPLPMLPRRIGIVTSPTGAAIRDMLHVLGRRFSNVHVILYPARVQGAEAAGELVEGIRTLDRHGVDVIILGRGGGSLEDLWPFNEEAVVRAVYAAETPIISAVGHEIDFALTDFAADVRAPTPSAAAEMVVQERQVLADRVAQLEHRLARGMERRVERVRHRLDLLQRSAVLSRPEELLREARQSADDLRMRLEEGIAEMLQIARRRLEAAGRALGMASPQARLARVRQGLLALRWRAENCGAQLPQGRRARLQTLCAQLDALSPLAILSRGYALAWRGAGEELVRSSKQLSEGDVIRLRFGEGGARARILETNQH